MIFPKYKTPYFHLKVDSTIYICNAKTPALCGRLLITALAIKTAHITKLVLDFPRTNPWESLIFI